MHLPLLKKLNEICFVKIKKKVIRFEPLIWLFKDKIKIAVHLCIVRACD